MLFFSPGYRWRTDDDDDISREIRDALNPNPYPPFAPTPYYPSRCGRLDFLVVVVTMRVVCMSNIRGFWLDILFMFTKKTKISYS